LVLLCGAVVWGVTSLIIDQRLRDEFDAKTRIFEQLRKRPQAMGDGALALSDQAASIVAVSETQAASELQKTVLTSLNAAGGVVRSIQADMATNTTDDGLRHLTAQVSFDGPPNALQEFLFAIETAVPYIFVESMIVQPSSDPSVGADRLRITLVASSY